MADATARFAIKLADEVTGSADAAAGALDNLRQKIDGDQKALRAMENAMRGLQRGTLVNIDAFRSLAGQIAQKKTAIAGATADFVALGGSFNAIRKPAQNAGGAVSHAAASVDDLQQAAGAAGGPIGGLIGRIKDLAGAGLAGVAIAATAAVVALGAVAAVAASRLVAFAFGAADAARSELLLMQAASGSADGARELASAVYSAANATALGRTQITQYGLALSKAGLRGAALAEALEAVSIAETAAGKGDALLEKMTAAKKAGQSISDLAAKTRKELGGVAAAQALSFSNQVAKAGDNIKALFAGINIEPFLKGLRSVLSIFDQSTASGQALKGVVDSIFSPIATGAANAMPHVRAFFLGVATGALKAATHVLLVGIAIKKAAGIKFGGSELAIDFNKVGVAAGYAAVGIGVLAAVAAGLLGALVAIPAVVFGVGAALGIGIATGVMLAVNTGMALWNWLENTTALLAQAVGELRQAGQDMMAGLASGITSGASKVITAATNAAKSAVTAVEKALDMHSPSRVMMKRGVHIPGGLAEGIDKGAPEVERAASHMLSIPAETAAVPTGAAPSSSSKSVVLNIAAVNVTGVQGADDPSFEEKLAAALSGVAQMIAAAEPA